MALGLTTLISKWVSISSSCFIVTLVLFTSRDWVCSVGVATIPSVHFLFSKGSPLHCMSTNHNGTSYASWYFYCKTENLAMPQTKVKFVHN